MHKFANVGDALIDPVLEKIFFDPDDKSPPSVMPEPPILAGLTDKEFGALLKIIRPRLIPAGTVLLKQGEKGKSIYLISRGRVLLTAKNKKGETITVESLTHGDMFGEAALFGTEAGGVSKTNVFAFDEVAFFEIKRSDLEELAAELPNLQRQIEQLYKTRVVDALLWESDIFGVLSAKERRRLVEDAQIDKFPQASRIFAEGDTSDEFYIVKSGEVHAFKEGLFEGKLVVNDFFGEISALQRVPRPHTVKAGPGGAECVVLNGGTLWKIARKNAEVTKLLEEVIEQRS
jgi:CRP-like cAMP-binding protein